MNTQEGLRYRLELDSFNSVYLISTYYEGCYLYLKSEHSETVYRMNVNTEKLYKWIDAYATWDTVDSKLIYVQSDSVWDYRMDKQNEYVHFGD